WYLIARPEAEDRPRTYRLVRFRALDHTGQRAEVPEAFDLGAYFGNAWAVYRGDRSYDVELRFGPEAADAVVETTWHHTQQVRRRDCGRPTRPSREPPPRPALTHRNPLAPPATELLPLPGVSMSDRDDRIDQETARDVRRIHDQLLAEGKLDKAIAIEGAGIL